MIFSQPIFRQVEEPESRMLIQCFEDNETKVFISMIITFFFNKYESDKGLLVSLDSSFFSALIAGWQTWKWMMYRLARPGEGEREGRQAPRDGQPWPLHFEAPQKVVLNTSIHPSPTRGRPILRRLLLMSSSCCFCFFSSFCPQPHPVIIPYVLDSCRDRERKTISLSKLMYGTPVSPIVVVTRHGWLWHGISRINESRPAFLRGGQWNFVKLHHLMMLLWWEAVQRCY